MFKYFFLFILLTLSSLQLLAQERKTPVQKFTISGYVKEASSGELMIGANVYIKDLLTGTTSNQYGFYSITMPQGNYTLVISYIGYKTQEFPLKLDKDTRINAGLESSVIQTREVVITGEKQDKNVQSTEMGTVKLEVEQIKKLPAFLGEVDVMKAVQLIPGVKSAGDGNSGFYVRGGGGRIKTLSCLMKQ